jgi:xylobiose transport system permease protein
VKPVSGRERPGIYWAAPAGLLFLTFGLVPIVGVAIISCTDWNGLGDPTWVGLDNWRAMGDDADLPNAIGKTLQLSVLCWAFQTPPALLLGVWSAATSRYRAVLSTIFFLPLLMSTVAIVFTWLSLLDPNFGLPAQLATELGFTDTNLLGDPDRALYGVAGVIAWQFVPFHALMYQSATRQIPAVLYEAATIDGAGRLRQFWAVTLPQLRNTIVASSVLIIVGSLTYFESILLLTSGGPGNATRVLPLHMYQKGFVAFKFGYAAAVAVLLVVLGTALSLVIVRLTGYHKMTSQADAG